MVRELLTVDITSTPELLRLAREVNDSGEPCVLTHGNEKLAVLSPVKTARRSRTRKGAITKDDPLFGLIGIGKSGIDGGVSGKKHEYLARAYRPK